MPSGEAPGASGYETCAFLTARKQLIAAKVVVANHDLVLTDVMQAAEEPETVLPFDTYNVILD